MLSSGIVKFLKSIFFSVLGVLVPRSCLSSVLAQYLQVVTGLYYLLVASACAESFSSLT